MAALAFHLAIGLSASFLQRLGMDRGCGVDHGQRHAHPTLQVVVHALTDGHELAGMDDPPVPVAAHGKDVAAVGQVGALLAGKVLQFHSDCLLQLLRPMVILRSK